MATLCRLVAIFLFIEFVSSNVIDSDIYRCPSGLPDTTSTLTYGDRCYQFVDDEMYWDEARTYCWQYGGRLVKIMDDKTNEFIMGALNRVVPWSCRGVWIGLHDRDGELDWEWVTPNTYVGEALSYSNWASGHPEGRLHSVRDCVRMVRGRRQDWKWHETFCSLFNWQYRFICEYEMSPETTPDPVWDPVQGDTSALGGAAPANSSGIETQGDLPEVPRQRPGVGHSGRNSEYNYDYEDYGDDYNEVYIDQKDGDYDVAKPFYLDLEDENVEKTQVMTLIMVACITIVLIVIVALFILLALRRRKSRRGLDHIVNPLYGADGDEKPVKIRAMNEYVVNVYSNPLPATPTDKVQHNETDEECLTTSSSVPNQSSLYEAEPSHRATVLEPYLPMGGVERREDVARGRIRPSSHYESPVQSHIYAEIPEVAARQPQQDEDDGPFYEEQIYETLEDLHGSESQALSN